MEVANGAPVRAKSVPDYGRKLCAIGEQPGCCPAGRDHDLEGLGAFELSDQGRVQLDDRACMVPGFGRGHLVDASLDAALGADRRAAAQRRLQLREARAQRGRKVRGIEIAQMVAESANQAPLDRTVADQGLDGLRETLGEVRQVCAFLLLFVGAR